MKQLHLEFMIEEFCDSRIVLGEKIQEQLISLMGSAIIEVLGNEREGKSDDNLSEQ